MKLFREENIQKIIGAIELDEYDDTIQDQNVKQDDFLPELQTFLNLYVDKGNVLEIGCGSGDSIGKYGITHGIEPCSKRFEKCIEKKLEVKQNVVECIEYDTNFFDSVIMMNGFFQVRSDYEALIEINRVLKIGGKFLFNILTNDKIDIVLGRCLGPKNYIRLVQQFGFEVISRLQFNAGARFYPQEQLSTVFCFEKIREFDNKFLNLPQVKDIKDIKNFIIERDWKLI